MGIYAITGGATGIGAAVKARLKNQGDTVIVVDIKDADIIADLSTEAGRQTAIGGIQSLAPDGLDGFIPCAGLGPTAKDWGLVVAVNYFGVRSVTEGLQEWLVKKQGRVVIISSNSASLPGTDETLLTALGNNDEAAAKKIVSTLDGHHAYAGSKRALTKWMRSVTSDFIQSGVGINAIAPGATMTPLLEEGLGDEVFGDLIRDFKGPLDRYCEPEEMADIILFLLSDKAAVLGGVVLFADGGMDATLRPEEF